MCLRGDLLLPLPPSKVSIAPSADLLHFDSHPLAFINNMLCVYLCSTAADWRKLFFDHIWPARNKWTGGLAESDFNIQARNLIDTTAHMYPIHHPHPFPQVAVRFKPGTVEDVKLVLPLHQRLRMRKAGEELVSKEPAHFLDVRLSLTLPICFCPSLCLCPPACQSMTLSAYLSVPVSAGA